MIEVRPATAADVELLASWAEAMAWETEHKRLDPATIRRGVGEGIADPARARYFIAVGGASAPTSKSPLEAGNDANPKIALGTLMLTTEWSDWRCGWWWWIQSVYVPPQHRRGGVLRALYEHVHAEAVATGGVCGLRLYVEHGNEGAQKTYAALGMGDAGYRMFEAGLPWLKGVIEKK